MVSEQDREIWQVDAAGRIYDVDFAEMTSWIDEGSLLRQDKVRKGNLRWIEAGKVPSLVAVFNAKDAGTPVDPPVITTTRLEPSTFSGPAETKTLNFSRPARQTIQTGGEVSGPDTGSQCCVHPDLPAAYLCGTCSSKFCRACPNSYGGTVKICPYCGAMCSSIDQVRKLQKENSLREISRMAGFGLSDLVNSVFHPLRFKASLIFGALMYMFLSLGGSVASFGGIFMFTAGIVCVMLANTLTFGVLANTVENFTQGKLQSNFMPTFDEFSLWDDVVHPFFLMIGVYVSSFGPALIIVIATFFFISNALQKEAANFEDFTGRAVVPNLPYAENAAKQSERVRQLLNKQRADQERRVKDIEDGMDTTTDVNGDAGSISSEDANFEQMARMIQEQRKAQLGQTLGKSPEDMAQEREGLLSELAGYGFVSLLAIGISILWGAFYYPAACAVAGYTRSFSATVNPSVGLDTIRRLGFDYFKILLMLTAMGLVIGVIYGLVATLLSPFDIPMLGNIPAKAIDSLIGFYFFVVFACLIGSLLYKASDRLKLPGT